MRKVKFDCHGHNAPAYSCSEPNDQSGEYVNVKDLPEFAREVATEFFYWWHNQPGTNTQAGFQDWLKLNAERFGLSDKCAPICLEPMRSGHTDNLGDSLA